MIEQWAEYYRDSEGWEEDKIEEYRQGMYAWPDAPPGEQLIDLTVDESQTAQQEEQDAATGEGEGLPQEAHPASAFDTPVNMDTPSPCPSRCPFNSLSFLKRQLLSNLLPFSDTPL